MDKGNRKIVVVGGVAAGPKAAARLRRLDPQADITIVEEGAFLSYAGCGLPYFVGGDVDEIQALMSTPVGIPRDAAFFREVKNIRVRERTRALAIDRQAKTLRVRDLTTGNETILAYDKLVLATGGAPVAPPLPGADLAGVHRIWTPEDALALRRRMREKGVQDIVVVGGGLIGLEMAEAFAQWGMRLTVIEAAPHLLPGLLDGEMAFQVAKHLRSQGVAVYAGETVQAIVGDSQGRVQAVQAAGREMPAQVVLLATGVRPNARLAEAAGLALGPQGGVAVDERLRTSDPDIFAGGDCVEHLDRMRGKTTYAPLGSTANKHGRIIGDNLLGRGAFFGGIVGTTVAKVFAYHVGKTGLTETQAREAGYDAVTALAPATDAPHYYPTRQLVFLKLVADRKTRRLLGCQTTGPGEGVKRIDVAATALYFQAAVDDLARLDLGYAPPFATAVDLLAHGAHIVCNKLDGIARGLSPAEVQAKRERGEDFVWLDVRSPGEVKQARIDDPRVRHIPLGELRRRLGELPRDREIIAFCQFSVRGYEAQTILDGAGFPRTAFLDGGAAAWPYDLVEGA